jgi:hypothetical protein
MSAKCLAVRRGLFSDRVKLYSEHGDSVVLGSLLGDREFFIRPRSSVTLKVPKRWMVQVGEDWDLEDWVTWGARSNAWSLPWRWRN